MNKALNYEERKRWACLLYTTRDATIPDIALETNTDEAIVKAWEREDQWAGIKRSRLTSRAAQIDFLYNVLENLRNKDSKEVSPKDADLMLKYTASIHNLEEGTTVTELVEVSELFLR